MAILLIGSTGNGKSTLGNFIVNPDKDHIFGDHQTFKTARTNMPETQIVESSSFSVKLERVEDQLTVIDTPGIFEDEDKDIQHMMNIIKSLHSVGQIRACLLVVRFSSKIDTPYKSSVKYYSKLLPGVFEKNLITVVTDYASDERSKSLRALQGIDEEQVKSNIVTEIVSVSGISHTPKLFTIDCLPITNDEFTVSRHSRDDIIRHIFSFKCVSTRDLKVAKTDSILAADKVAIARLEGEVTAYEERLEQSSLQAESTRSKVEEYARKVSNLESGLGVLKRDLIEKDKNELVEADTWSVSNRWKWFKKRKADYEVISKWLIQNVVYSDNGRCRWIKDETGSEYCIKGVVKSKLNRGLFAKLTVQVYKCDKHGEDINYIKADIASKEEQFSEAKESHETNKQRHDEINNEIVTLAKSIDEKKKEISKLSSEYLTMEECVERFPQ